MAKLPNKTNFLNLSTKAKDRFTRGYALFSAVMVKLIPVLVLALIFSQVAIAFDQKHYREADASEFLKYTEFTVQNARENEDVNFKVCRERVSNIAYKGDLGIFIIANADKDNETTVKVYNRNIGGTINNDCENKVVRASDFKHDTGTYEMGFCVRFNVKYGYEKELCKTSNRYRIYAQPDDLESKIKDLQLQLDNARKQRDDSAGDINQPQDNSLAVPENTQPQDSSNNSQSSSGTDRTDDVDEQTETGVEPPTCALNPLGLGLICGSDGLLRL